MIEIITVNETNETKFREELSKYLNDGFWTVSSGYTATDSSENWWAILQRTNLCAEGE